MNEELQGDRALEIPKFLEQLRTRRGWTQTEFVENVRSPSVRQYWPLGPPDDHGSREPRVPSASTIGRWLRGGMPSRDQFPAIAKALDVSPQILAAVYQLDHLAGPSDRLSAIGAWRPLVEGAREHLLIVGMSGARPISILNTAAPEEMDGLQILVSLLELDGLSVWEEVADGGQSGRYAAELATSLITLRSLSSRANVDMRIWLRSEPVIEVGNGLGFTGAILANELVAIECGYYGARGWNQRFRVAHRGEERWQTLESKIVERLLGEQDEAVNERILWRSNHDDRALRSTARAALAKADETLLSPQRDGA